LGIPKDSILRCETVLKTDKFVLIAHGTDTEMIQAREIINRTNPEAAEHHQPLPTNPEACIVAGNRPVAANK
jgi:hypothetical protein